MRNVLEIKRLVSLAAILMLAACTVHTEPVDENALSLVTETRIQEIELRTEPVHGAISLYEAMARAIKYNLDNRVKILERNLEEQAVNVARSDLLPDLVANSHYSGRNDRAFSSSVNRVGLESLEPSTSRDRNTLVSDLTFSWHILDFGLSHVRAQQAADKALIAEENRRRVIQEIIEQVQSAYWRAVTAEELIKRVKTLDGRVNRALKNSRQLSREGDTSPLKELLFQRELVDIKRQLKALQNEFTSAHIELASLMNLKANTKFSVVAPKRSLRNIDLKVPHSEMISTALKQRSEIRELFYESRINKLEAEAAMLEILPGIQLYSGVNADTNSFLLENNWVSWGARASWNVLKVFAYPTKKGLIEGQGKLIEERAMAMTVAIMTQVQVAHQAYHHARSNAALSQQYAGIQRQINVRQQASADVEEISEQILIQEEMNTLLALARYDVAYAEVQNTFARFYATLGFEPLGENADSSLSVSELAKQLKIVWSARGQKGH